MKKRVIGYARVSTEKQDLERQISLIKGYCKRQEFYLIEIISEKVSGAKKDRESINRLLEVDSTIADMIVVSELSRLSREAEIMSLLSIVNYILNSGLDVLFLDSPSKIYNAYSSLSLIDIITLSVEAHAASEERNKIAIRMNTGIYTKFQVNPYIYTGGGAIPLGFKVIDNPEYKNQTDNRPAKRILTIDQKEKISAFWLQAYKFRIYPFLWHQPNNTPLALFHTLFLCNYQKPISNTHNNSCHQLWEPKQFQEEHIQ